MRINACCSMRSSSNIAVHIVVYIVVCFGNRSVVTDGA